MSFLKGLGNLLNDTMGATSAGAQSQKYAMASAAVNNAYQKEAAQNAHQWEVEDLEKAGLNPILSAGGNGASLSGGGVSAANVSASGINPFETIMNGISGITGAKKTLAETKNIDADTLNKGVQQQLFKIDLMIKAGRSSAEIKEAFKQLELIEKQKEKLTNEIKKIKGGKAAEYIGTGIIENAKQGAKELTDKAINKIIEHQNNKPKGGGR